MKAVHCREPGGAEVLEIVEIPRPTIAPSHVLVRNFATALNRADILQRRGLYPPPPGDSDILGLEFAGEVAEVGSSVRELKVGDRVFGLTGSGGYAEFLPVHEALCLPIPDNLPYDLAAAVPEAFYTAHDAIFTLGKLQAGETLLVHAGASGVGTAAIQLGCAFGAQVFATAGSAEKVKLCTELGAVKAVNYREEDFAAALLQSMDAPIVDVVLDLVGASHWEGNLRCLRLHGRLLVVGLLAGTKVEVDLGVILRKRLRVLGTTLRSRTLAEKVAVTRAFAADALSRLAAGELRPILDRVYPLEEVSQAHERMEQNLNLGKIVLRM